MSGRIGSWPGREDLHNRFVSVLLDALEARGWRVVDAPDVSSIRPEALDVLVLHWPERVFFEARGAVGAARVMARLIWRLATRPRRVKVIWIVHNRAPHEARGFKRMAAPWLIAATARLADGLMTLSPGTAFALEADPPGGVTRPVDWFWHPAYPDAAADPTERAKARAVYGLEDGATVLGYGGQLRGYKGLATLAQAFAATAGDDLRLLIAGLPADPALAETLVKAAERDPRMRVAPRDLSAEEYRLLLAAMDVFVAPFDRYFHSGSLVHALSAGRPVLTPATPFSRSLVDAIGPRSVWLYDGAPTPKVLRDAVDATRSAAGEAPDLTALAPQAAARRIEAFARHLGAAVPQQMEAHA